MKTKETPVLYIWIFAWDDDEPADFCNDHWIKSRGQGQEASFIINTRKKNNVHSYIPFMIRVFTKFIKTQMMETFKSSLHYHVSIIITVMKLS